MADRVITVPQATLIAQAVKGQIDNTNERLGVIKADLQNSIETLKDGIATDNLVDLSSISLWKPGESDGTRAPYKIYQDIKHPCSSGETFYIASVAQQLMHYTTCGFFDSEDNSLGRQYSYSASDGVFMTKTAIAPNNAAYMMVSISTGVGSVSVTPESFFASNPQIYVGKTNITQVSDIYKKYETVPFPEFYALRDEVLDGTVHMPTYWQTYMGSKIKTLQDLDGTIGAHGFSFVFITDIHWQDNYKKAPMLIQHILDKTTANMVVCGGDILTKNNSIDEAMAVINDWGNSTNKLGTVNVFGNHDNNSSSGNAESLWIGYDRWYGALLRPIENRVVWSDDKKYFYMDNAAQKVRMIFLNTGYDQGTGLDTTQAAWMQQLLYHLESGWKAIVFTHMFFAPATVESGVTELSILESGTLAKNMIDGQYDNMVAHSADFIGVVTGHVHRDYSIVSSKGYPIIGTTCDANGLQASLYDPVNTVRTAGTTTEQAFDVYHVDTANRKIYVTRIGAGSDREFSF